MITTFQKSNILSMIVLLSVFLSGCSAFNIGAPMPQVLPGDVIALQPGTTRWLIEQAMQAKPGTFILNKENYWVFGGVLNGNLGFVTLDLAKSKAMNLCSGQIVECRTGGDFIKWLIASGWVEIGAKAVPALQIPLLEMPSMFFFFVPPALQLDKPPVT